MTRRFDFDSYKIVFNGHHFQGDGHLLGLPRTPKDVYGGELIVSSRPTSPILYLAAQLNKAESWYFNQWHH